MLNDLDWVQLATKDVYKDKDCSSMVILHIVETLDALVALGVVPMPVPVPVPVPVPARA